MSSQALLYYSKLLAYLVSVLFLAGIGAFIYQKYVSYRLRLKLKRRFFHAKEGEVSAESLLKQKGYDLTVTQKSAKLSMWVNGEKYSYLVRPDAFAEKEGKRYIVEIKTGSLAIDPKKSATRRQLLEYYHGFDVDGLLLIDAEQHEVHDIYFESKAFKRSEIVERVVISKKATIMAFFCGMLLTATLVYISQRNK